MPQAFTHMAIGYDKETLLKRVRNLLTLLSERIHDDNAVGHYDLNRVTEDILCPILNIAFGYSLENKNVDDPRYPAIDLGDYESRTSFQITSKLTTDKATKTLRMFNKRKMYEQYDVVYLLSISSINRTQIENTVKKYYDTNTNPKKSKSQKSISPNTKPKLSIPKTKVFVMDRTALYKHINRVDSELLYKIHQSLSNSIDRMESSIQLLEMVHLQDNLSNPHWGIASIILPDGTIGRSLVPKHTNAQKEYPINFGVLFNQEASVISKLDNLLRKGIGTTFTSKEIEKLTYPKLLESEFRTDGNYSLHLIPLLKERKAKIYLRFIDIEGKELCRFTTEINLIREGTDECEYNNHNQDTAFKVEFTLIKNDNHSPFRFILKWTGYRVKTLLESLRTYIALLKSSTIEIFDDYDDNKLFLLSKESDNNISLEREYEKILEAIYNIEKHYHLSFTIPEKDISGVDLATIFAIDSFIRDSYCLMKRKNNIIEVSRQNLSVWKELPTNTQIIFRQIFNNYEIELFGKSFNIGKLLTITLIFIDEKTRNSVFNAFDKDSNVEYIHIEVQFPQGQYIWAYGSEFIPSNFENLDEQAEKAIINRCLNAVSSGITLD